MKFNIFDRRGNLLSHRLCEEMAAARFGLRRWQLGSLILTGKARWEINGLVLTMTPDGKFIRPREWVGERAKADAVF